MEGMGKMSTWVWIVIGAIALWLLFAGLAWALVRGGLTQHKNRRGKTRSS
jgi:hypothetical protein